jgi:hypothetical protein
MKHYVFYLHVSSSLLLKHERQKGDEIDVDNKIIFPALDSTLNAARRRGAVLPYRSEP